MSSPCFFRSEQISHNRDAVFFPVPEIRKEPPPRPYASGKSSPAPSEYLMELSVKKLSHVGFRHPLTWIPSTGRGILGGRFWKDFFPIFRSAYTVRMYSIIGASRGIVR